MNIAVYCGSGFGANPAYAEAARELGAWIAESRNGLVYGGSSVGLMGTVSSAVMKGGGQAIGVEPKFFIDAGVAQHGLTELIVVDTMSQRKEKMIELSDAFIALPGGVGTLEEISEIMSRIRLRLTMAPCIFLNIDGFYDHLAVYLDGMAAQGFVEPYERDLFIFANSVEDVAQALKTWRPPTQKPIPWREAQAVS